MLNKLSITIQGANLHGKPFTVGMFTILWAQCYYKVVIKSDSIIEI